MCPTPPGSLHSTPHPWPLAIAQAEIEKLGVRGVHFMVQRVAQTWPWLLGLAQYSLAGDMGLRAPYLLKGLEVPVREWSSVQL